MEKSQSAPINKPKKYMKRPVIVALSLVALFKGPSCVQHMQNINQIKNNRLEYTTEGGWIDRGHATSGGATHLRDRINNPQDLPNTADYGLVHYGQHRRFGRCKTGVEKRYIVKKDLDMVEKKAVALAIFLEISRAFEEHQGSFDKITGSSYSEPDLFSDVIGFYRGVEGYTRIQVEQYLNPIGIDSSLALYHKYGIGKNTSIGTIITYDDDTIVIEKYPYPFNQIRTVEKGRVIGEKGILFKERVDIQSSQELTFCGYNSMGFDVFTVNKDYEKDIAEETVKQRLSQSNPDIYKDPQVLIEDKCGYREVVVKQ